MDYVVDGSVNTHVDWPLYRDVAIRTYINDPWLLEVYPDYQQRLKYVRKHCDEFYENVKAEKGCCFTTFKATDKNGQETIIGEMGLVLKIPDINQNDLQSDIDSKRFDFCCRQIFEPLKSIAEKHDTQAWYGTLYAIEPHLQRRGVGQQLARKGSEVLVRFAFNKCKDSGIKWPPLVFLLAQHDIPKNHLMKTDAVYIGNASCSLPGLHDSVPNYVFILPIGNETESIIEEAKIVISK